MSLEGGTAVVTGGGRGIGRAFRERLVIDGANLVLVGRHGAAAVLDEKRRVAVATILTGPHRVVRSEC